MSKKNTAIYKHCEICNHPICDNITDIYFDSGQDYKKIIDLFKKAFNIHLTKDQVLTHFNEHVERTYYDTQILKQEEIKNLNKKAENTNNHSSQIMNNMQQIIWERMLTIYLSSPRETKIKDQEVVKHSKQTKEICDLAKAFRDNQQQQLEIIGMGKTEEEQKELMENYVSNLLKKAVNTLDEMPDAKKKIEDFINISFED